MSTEDFKRKLAAILSADVVGYSRLMGEDEESTIITLTEYRNIISSLIEKHRGRVVDSPGDNLLAEFTSVVDAVQCSVEIQRKIFEKNEEFQDNRKMEYRIGVNVGDVVEEGDRIYGDGVNITARLESLAEPGGICISGFVYNQVKNRLELEYEYLGEQSVKNIKEPVPVYRVLSFPGEAAHKVIEAKKSAEKEIMASSFFRKPSIAILPFVNLSGDPEQEYFSDGVTEDIITALLKIRWFLVTARNSTFSYKGKSVDVRQVANELGVRYVLEGSVRKAGNRVRISAQLIEGLTRNHVWAENYDRELADVFEVQDEITRTVIGAIEPELTKAELGRVKMKRPENMDAWDLCQRGMWYRYQNTKAGYVQARQYFHRAIDLDPQLGLAYAGLSEALSYEIIFHFTEAPTENGEEAIQAARKCIELDPEDARARISLGRAYIAIGQAQKAIPESQIALKMNPHSATAHYQMGAALVISGRAEESISYLETAIRLSPKDIYVGPFLARLGQAYLALKEYEKAVKYSRDALRHPTTSWHVNTYEVSALGSLGHLKEARESLSELLRRRPGLKISHLREGFVSVAPNNVQDFLVGLRKAGLPEGSQQTIQEKPSIAVLPFVNMSNDPEQEYFSDGMTEELISALSNLEGLKVISRTSSFFFKGKDVDLHTIGDKLRVEHIIEGSVRKAGNRLRITAQLIKVADDTHLWSETYNREIEDVFAIQENISKAIVDRLKIGVLGKEPIVKTYTENMDAYESFIKGRYLYFSFMEGSMEKAIQHYKRAIALDPNYAPAYSAIAEWYWSLPFKGQEVVTDDFYAEAKEAINKALEIDNNLAEAHANLGIVRFVYEWDWKGAEKEFEVALSLNPGSSKSHYDYAFYLLAVAGNFDKSISEARKAVELDPLSGNAHFFLGTSLFASGQVEQGIEKLRYTLEMVPKHLPCIRELARAYTEKGMLEEAIAEIKKGLSLFPKDSRLQSDMARIHAIRGEKEKARVILDELLKRSTKEYVPSFFIASVCAYLGEIDQTFEYLENGLEKREAHGFFLIKLSPLTRLLGTDPRFITFLKQMGLED